MGARNAAGMVWVDMWRRQGGRDHRSVHALRQWAIWLACAAVVAALWISATLAWDRQRMIAAGQLRGPVGVAAANALQELLNYAGTLDEPVKLATVNVFFNRRILFRDDLEVWHQQDYWASPLELLWKGQGDCEDYAIAKYFSLLAIGMAPQRLRLVYVRATLGPAGGPQVAHMVLAYYPPLPETPETLTTEPWILDNLVGEIRPASQRPDLTPVFSFSVEGLWQGTSGTRSGDPLARLSRWRDVLDKARDEGLP
jgi:predicted transglutaminase-like cysteine proteinase